MITNNVGSNGVCVRCGKDLEFPNGVIVQAIRVLSFVTMDSYGVESSYKGPMFLCFSCNEKLHRNLEKAAKQLPPGE